MSYCKNPAALNGKSINDSIDICTNDLQSDHEHGAVEADNADGVDGADGAK